jgi:hypothetical protein
MLPEQLFLSLPPLLPEQDELQLPVATSAGLTSFQCDSNAYCCAFAPANRIVVGDGGGRVHFLALEE